jgi:hypothetical protein
MAGKPALVGETVETTATETPSSNPRRWRGAGWRERAPAAVVALYALALLYGIAANLEHLQWDFKTYFYAGRAFSLGLDPYDLDVLSRLAGEEIGFPYTYAPATLPVFTLFSALELPAASAVFLGLKLVALAALILLWRRWFLHRPPDLFFYLFMIFGFGGALYADMAAGNISVFEQLGIWLALLALQGGRRWIFALLIALVGVWKLAPILLLGILILSDGRRAWGPLAAGLALFAALLGISYLVWPDLFASFFAVAQSFDERGGINPSSLAFFRDIYDYLAGRGISPGPEAVPWITYAAWVGLVALLTWRAVRNRRGGDLQPTIFLTCLAFALISPRFKNYAYVLLVVPVYELLRSGVSIRQERALLLLLMFSGSPPVPFGFSAAAQQMIGGYYSLLGALLIWALSLGGAEKTSREAIGGDAASVHPTSRRVTDA